MEPIKLSPIETLIAKPPKERTPLESVIVISYRLGDPGAERAARELLSLPPRLQHIASSNFMKQGRR